MSSKVRDKSTEEVSILKMSMQTLSEYLRLKSGRDVRVVRSIGYKFGSEMAQRISATKLDALIDELRLYWVRNGIGEIDWADKNNMYLKIQKCVDCFDSRYTNYKLCPFKEGYLEAILRTKLGVPLRVREVECCSMKVNCIFHIKFLFDDPLLIQVRA